MATMSSSSFSSQVLVSLKIDRPRLPSNNTSCSCARSILLRVRSDIGSKLSRKQTALKETNNKCSGFSFSGESAAIKSPNLCSRNATRRKRTAVSAMWLPSSQIASSAFTFGTAAVLPFYSFMVIAPKAQLTEKIVASSIPYIVLGLIYAFLLYLSWTPDTIRLMFGSKYWLPELSGIAKMFSSEMTLASAWIHLLSVDLFAARQVHNDGLQNDIETRHSVSLCLLFCPIGIITHFITKAVTRSWRIRKEHGAD